VSTKNKVEWAYRSLDDWVVVDPKSTQDTDGSAEKKIGFEGTPDPSTGFYCLYNAGRLVASADDAAPQGSSKKVKSYNSKPK
jgi:hypothetical protein